MFGGEINGRSFADVIILAVFVSDTTNSSDTEIFDDCQPTCRFSLNKSPIALPISLVDDLRNECPK